MIWSTKGHWIVTKVLLIFNNVVTIQMLGSEVDLTHHLSRYGHLVCGQKVFWHDQRKKFRHMIDALTDIYSRERKYDMSTVKFDRYTHDH